MQDSFLQCEQNREHKLKTQTGGGGAKGRRGVVSEGIILIGCSSFNHVFTVLSQVICRQGHWALIGQQQLRFQRSCKCFHWMECLYQPIRIEISFDLIIQRWESLSPLTQLIKRRWEDKMIVQIHRTNKSYKYIVHLETTFVFLHSLDSQTSE